MLPQDSSVIHWVCRVAVLISRQELVLVDGISMNLLHPKYENVLKMEKHLELQLS